MVHLKIIFDKRRQKSDGTYPISYRVTDVKKVFYIASGISVETDYWNDETRVVTGKHPNSSIVNTNLYKKYYEIQKAIMELEANGTFSFQELKEILSPQKETKSDLSFYDFSQKLIQDLLLIKRPGNAIVYRTAIARLVKHAGTNHIKFTDINYNLLESFNHRLLADKVKLNTISNYMRAIRAIYNKGVKEKLVNRSDSPFYDLSIKSEKTIKRATSIESINQLKKIDLKTNSNEWHSRNYFFLSFYLIGISFTDLAYLKPDNIINGRMEFRRRKTHKLYSIKLFPQSIAILKIYTKPDCEYLLPVLSASIEEDSLQSKNIIYQWIKTTNKHLKRLGKTLKNTDSPLTTYVARHTWATIAKRLGYSNELIAEALGHEYGNRVTNIYLDGFDKEVVDRMHEVVITL